MENVGPFRMEIVSRGNLKLIYNLRIVHRARYLISLSLKLASRSWYICIIYFTEKVPLFPSPFHLYKVQSTRYSFQMFIFKVGLSERYYKNQCVTASKLISPIDEIYSNPIREIVFHCPLISPIRRVTGWYSSWKLATKGNLYRETSSRETFQTFGREKIY